MTIDFHAHILPGLDHGSSDLNMSLEQLLKAKKTGIDLIAATSHFNPYVETTENFLLRRQKSWVSIQSVWTPDLPRIILGAEALICNNMNDMEGLLSLAFQGTSVILIEMPFGDWDRKLICTVEKVNERCKGCAVLAHVDRYDKKNVEILFDMGIKGQVNVAGLFNLFRRSHLDEWIEQGSIVGLGSDIHRDQNVYDKFRNLEIKRGEIFSKIMRASEDLLFSDSTLSTCIVHI
jgi:protein-tyrosine phosphatase